MATLRALLIDLDGVIYQDEELLEGAPSALAWIRSQAIPHAYVTNTTSRPRRALVDKLARFGIQAAEEQLITPAVVASQWLRREDYEPAALFVTAPTRADFNGVRILPEDAETGAGSVVLGDLGSAWNFTILNQAFRLLMANPNAPLIALGTTRYWRACDGLRMDVGPFVAALEHASGRLALVLGKPSREFFGIAQARLNCSAAETAMVGDDIIGDVDGAQRAGMRGVLVRTGKFRDSDLQGGIRPDAVLGSIAELPSWWLKCAGSFTSHPRESDADRSLSSRAETMYLNIIGAMLDLLLGCAPSGRPYSSFRTEHSVISALVAHHGERLGICERTLQATFSEATRKLSGC